MEGRRPTGSMQSVSASSLSLSHTPSSGSGKFGTFFLGRYRVVDEIGIGGMASVHLARADGPGGFQKWVAIKRIHPHLVEDDQFIHMFLDEARIAARISHANVAQVFDLGEGDGTYWIAMEYLHGEPLREVMRCVEEGQPRMPTELAAKVIADAAEGLHAAHDLRGKGGELLGLVHRDVTPHNLFVTYDGTVKVVDFGIAKVAGRLSSTRAGTLKGKLAYMSPEQVRGAEIDRRTDIFALGVVLWELTTGHRLFRMESDLETLEKVQACIVPPPSTIVPDYPVELESIVMRALAKNPDARFQTARELARALSQHMLRRGVFIGPEDVAGYIRAIFGDRIKKRDAHLRWAAEVTQTINIDEFRAQQNAPTPEASGGDISLVTYASEVHPSVNRTQTTAGGQPQGRNAVTTRPPGQGSTRALPMPAPRPAAGAPMSSSTAIPVATPRPAAGLAALSATTPDGIPAARPELPAFAKSGPVPSFDNEDDDDDNIATIVAPARLLLPDSFERAPASGTPSNVSVAPSLTPAAGMPPSAMPGYRPLPGAGSPPPAPTPGLTQPFVAAAVSQQAPIAAPPPPRPADPTVQIAAQRGGRSNVLIAVLAAAMLLTAVGVLALVVLKLRGGNEERPSATDTAAKPEPTPKPLAADSAKVAATQAPAPAPADSAGTPTISLSALPVAATGPTATTTPDPKKTTTPTDKKDDAKKDDKKDDKKDAAGGNGFLTVVCNPFCDSVTAAGRSLGPSPVLKAPLPPGSHRVTLKKNGSPPKVLPVIIVSGETAALRVKMDLSRAAPDLRFPRIAPATSIVPFPSASLPTRRSRRLLRAGAALALGTLGLGVACSRSLATEIGLSDPDNQRARATWLEFDVFPNGCPDAQTLGTGVYSGALQTQVVPKDQALEPIGDLDPGSYGFAALLRDQDCGIVALGCTNADLKKIRSITIVVGPVLVGNEPGSVAACPGACNAGRCSGPGVDGGAGSGGSSGAGGAGGSSGTGGGGTGGSGGSPGGCTFDVVGKPGALPSPIEIGATVTGPAAVSTPTGFIVGYRDLSANGMKDRTVLVPIGSESTSTAPIFRDLTPCAGAQVDLGVGMGMNQDGTIGLLAVSRPPCAADGDGGSDNGAGITFVQFNAGGQVQDSLLLKGAPGFPAIALASQHAITRVPGSPNEFRISYAQGGVANSFPVTGVKTSPGASFDAIVPPLTGSSFVVSSSTNDVLVQATNVNGDGGQQLAVRLEPKGAAAKTVFRDPAAAAAVTSFGERTVLTTRNGAGEVAWVLLGKDGTSVASGTLPGGPYKGFDVAVINDRIVFVAAQNLSYKLVWYKGATMMPGAMPEGTKDVKVDAAAELKSFDGSQIALSTGSGRALVTWVSRNQLGQADPTGGFALHRCE